MQGTSADIRMKEMTRSCLKDRIGATCQIQMTPTTPTTPTPTPTPTPPEPQGPKGGAVDGGPCCCQGIDGVDGDNGDGDGGDGGDDDAAAERRAPI